MGNEMQNILANCVGFYWDRGNSRKNWLKHQITPSECEQIYFNQPLLTKDDIKHSESRFFALGKTDGNRKLFIAFTIRQEHIHVISARDTSRKEREAYETI